MGFGFRVSIGSGEVKSSESVSGFGFRVSIGPGEVKSSESVSGFGFRVSQFETNSNSRFRVSGFGFRWSKPTLQTSLRITSPKTHVLAFSFGQVQTNFPTFVKIAGTCCNVFKLFWTK